MELNEQKCDVLIAALDFFRDRVSNSNSYASYEQRKGREKQVDDVRNKIRAFRKTGRSNKERKGN